MEIKCLNCGGVDLRFQKLGIPLRPQSGRPPQSELAVTAVECESCGFIGIFAGDQPEKHQQHRISPLPNHLNHIAAGDVGV
jgi:hypothetical protein